MLEVIGQCLRSALRLSFGRCRQNLDNEVRGDTLVMERIAAVMVFVAIVSFYVPLRWHQKLAASCVLVILAAIGGPRFFVDSKGSFRDGHSL